MKKFKELRESLKDSCWKGYEAIGTKKKNGKTVPNCVPTKEDTSWYPKKGFPKEGEYGYNPNPGLKPQESDKDKDMDVAYKKENEKEATKLPNARILEVPNKIGKVKAPVKESNVFTDARMNAIKAGKKAFVVGGKTYKITGDTSDEREAKATNESYEEAQKHLDKASKALETSDMHAHHQHMANHFEELGKWHESKGRGRSAQKAYDKAEEHHEKSLKEEVEQVDEMDKSQPSSSRGAEGLATGTKTDPEKYKDVKKSALAALRKAFATKNVKEEVINERGEDSKGYKRPTEDGAGLTRKGAKAAGVKTAVTTPPSKLDPEGKAAKRRKSFCARMSGMKGPMKDEKGRPTRKAMSLRRWNCN